MNSPTVHRLGDLQLKIMKVLWEKSEASIPEVHQTASQEADLAYTTISTMLRKMEA
jgi:BlaI family transcriptional regulator, penicillinase repressor